MMISPLKQQALLINILSVVEEMGTDYLNVC
jgi:hypothetical protein